MVIQLICQSLNAGNWCQPLVNSILILIIINTCSHYLVNLDPILLERHLSREILSPSVSIKVIDIHNATLD